MRIAIVMTAYNREDLLKHTLFSMWSQYQHFYDYGIYVDKDPDHPDKTWVNSCIAYNRVFRKALSEGADAVIIQNGECYHADDILMYVWKHLTSRNYISFPCYSLGKDDKLPPDKMNSRGATYDGDSAWYNHPVHRPVGYHFCSAITADNLRKLNGFDERFKDGKDYEDNYFLHQVRQLGLEIVIPHAPWVLHQWHYSSPRRGASNYDLYRQLTQQETNSYRAVHLINPDLS